MTTIVTPLDSITETIHRRVCPLYSFDRASRIHLIGSAIPFKSGGISFLITAAHVCADRHLQPVPLFTLGANGPLVLKDCRLSWEYRPGHTDRDIALIALSDRG